MTTTDFTTNEIERPAEPGSIGAGAEIYRRMERRSKARPMWMTAAPVAVLALAVAGGVVAYEATKPHAKPAPVQAQATPAAAPQVAATTPPPAVQPAQVAEAAPTPAAPAPVTHVIRHEARPVIAPVAHKRTARDANAASSAGEDTSAYTPAPQQRAVNPAPAAVRPAQAQPVQPAAPQPAAPVTHNFAPPSAAAPAPVTVTPPPAPATAAPADTPAGQP
jgi:hypothetical protein